MDTSVDRRLRPLLLASFLAAFILWIPVEKLFLSQIGFTPASIGLMAAVYAAVVPLVELPSGVLADRWSRRGVFVLAALAAAVCSLVGGLSQGIGLYLLCAVFLGVMVAMSSGVVDAMVYDVLLEETGTGDGFSRQIGRVRLVEGLGLTAGALGGGLLGELTSPRTTYFASVPLALVAAVVMLGFREPVLHHGDDGPVAIREQVRATLAAMGDRGTVVPVILLAACTGVALQLLFEFGPLWLVEAEAPTWSYGPYTALVFGLLAVGGLVAARVAWSRRGAVLGLVAGMAAGAVVATTTGHLPTIFAAHAALVLGLTLVGIHASQRLNDAIPSAVRAGVVSGASTVTWLVFLPVTLAFGVLAQAVGVQRAAWLLVVLVAVAGALLLRRPARALTCDEVVELGSRAIDEPLPPDTEAAVAGHRRLCPGCDRYLTQLRDLVASLRSVDVGR